MDIAHCRSIKEAAKWQIRSSWREERTPPTEELEQTTRPELLRSEFSTVNGSCNFVRHSALVLMDEAAKWLLVLGGDSASYNSRVVLN